MAESQDFSIEVFMEGMYFDPDDLEPMHDLHFSALMLLEVADNIDNAAIAGSLKAAASAMHQAAVEILHSGTREKINASASHVLRRIRRSYNTAAIGLRLDD